MNKYFGTTRAKYGGKGEHAKNVTLASIRSAILINKSMLLGTTKVDYWYDIIRKEFPDVPLRKTENGVVINEKKK